MTPKTLLRCEEARQLVLDGDGQPRWSPARFRRLLERGELPAVRLGGRWFVNPEELAEALSGNSRKEGTENG